MTFEDGLAHALSEDLCVGGLGRVVAAVGIADGRARLDRRRASRWTWSLPRSLNDGGGRTGSPGFCSERRAKDIASRTTRRHRGASGAEPGKQSPPVSRGTMVAENPMRSPAGSRYHADSRSRGPWRAGHGSGGWAGGWGTDPPDRVAHRPTNYPKRFNGPWALGMSNSFLLQGTGWTDLVHRGAGPSDGQVVTSWPVPRRRRATDPPGPRRYRAGRTRRRTRPAHVGEPAAPARGEADAGDQAGEDERMRPGRLGDPELSPDGPRNLLRIVGIRPVERRLQVREHLPGDRGRRWATPTSPRRSASAAGAAPAPGPRTRHGDRA